MFGIKSKQKYNSSQKYQKVTRVKKFYSFLSDRVSGEQIAAVQLPTPAYHLSNVKNSEVESLSLS